MKTSGLFTTHEYTVTLPGYNQEAPLILFGDVHRDSPNHATGAWRDFLAYSKSRKGAYFLGIGDYCDGVSSSERAALVRAGLHESTLANIESEAKRWVNKLAGELEFMRGRLVGLLGGNHYFGFEDGTTTDTRLSSALGCKFLGVTSFIRLKVRAACEANAFIAYDICANHGQGGGRTIGGSLNRVAQMLEWAEVDLVAMGHDHRRGVVPGIPRLFLEKTSKGGLRVKHRETKIARTGSFLAAYEPGTRNYNVDAARGPCSLGHTEVLLSIRKQTKRECGGTTKETWIETRGVA